MRLCVCLSCGAVGCGRDDHGHASAHAAMHKHPLSADVASAECWCYECDMFVGVADGAAAISDPLGECIAALRTAIGTRSGPAAAAPGLARAAARAAKDDSDGAVRAGFVSTVARCNAQPETLQRATHSRLATLCEYAGDITRRGLSARSVQAYRPRGLVSTP